MMRGICLALTAACLLAGAPAQAQQQPYAMQSGTRVLGVSDLIGAKMHSAQNTPVGEIDKVLIGPGRQVFIAVQLSGDNQNRDVLVPIENVLLRGKLIVTSGITDDQIKQLPAWNKQSGAYKVAHPRARLEIDCVEGCNYQPATEGSGGGNND